MNGKKRFLLASIAVLVAAWAGPARARDAFYYLGNGVVQVIDGDTDAVTATIPIQGWSRESLLTSDSRFLYVTASRHLVHKISLADNRLVATVDVSSDGWDRFIFGFVPATDDRTAYAAMMSRRRGRGEVIVGAPVVAQVDLETGRILRSVEVPWGVAQLVSVKEGSQVYALGKDLYKIDASGADMRVTETVPMFDKGWNVLPLWNYAWENGGRSLMNYYTATGMGLIAIDASTGAITDIPIPGDPVLAYSVTYSPDRKLVYAIMDDLTVIDLAGPSYRAAAPVQEGTSYGVSVSSDGKKVYVGAGGASVTVFDAATLRPVKVLQMSADGMDIRKVVF